MHERTITTPMGRTISIVGWRTAKSRASTFREGYNSGQDSIMFAGVFQFFFLRLAIFFGCLGIFMNLFRGEILDRSLHFYFLAPIRREVLMVGKVSGGAAGDLRDFRHQRIASNRGFSVALHSELREIYLYHNHGLEHAAVYVGVTVLACVGYGAFFLVAGMLFRNPISCRRRRS